MVSNIALRLSPKRYFFDQCSAFDLIRACTPSECFFVTSNYWTVCEASMLSSIILCNDLLLDSYLGWNTECNRLLQTWPQSAAASKSREWRGAITQIAPRLKSKWASIWRGFRDFHVRSLKNGRRGERFLSELRSMESGQWTADHFSKWEGTPRSMPAKGFGFSRFAGNGWNWRRKNCPSNNGGSPSRRKKFQSSVRSSSGASESAIHLRWQVVYILVPSMSRWVFEEP